MSLAIRGRKHAATWVYGFVVQAMGQFTCGCYVGLYGDVTTFVLNQI